MCFKHLAVLGLEMQCVGIGNAMCWDWKCNDPCMVKMSPVNVSEVTWRVHKVFKPNQDNPTVVLVQLRCCSCSYPFRSYTAGYLRVAFRILIAWFSEYSLMAFPYMINFIPLLFDGLSKGYRAVSCLLVLYSLRRETQSVHIW